MKFALTLEGGGTRGNYTAGVLETFLENEINADLVVGVSAGACNGCSYVARQPGRARRTNLDYVNDRRYAGVWCLIKERSVFGMKFNFDTIPNQLDPLDYDAMIKNPCQFISVVVDAETAKPVYFPKQEMRRGDYSIIRASSALPVFSPAVEINGRKYYDGGTVDPIPVHYPLEHGYNRVIVVLTQPKGYKKPQQAGKAVYSLVLRKYPKLIQAVKQRHIVYNRTLEELEVLEKEGKVLIMRPSRDLGAKRFTRDKELLERLYQLGCEDAKAALPRIREFISDKGGAENA